MHPTFQRYGLLRVRSALPALRSLSFDPAAPTPLRFAACHAAGKAGRPPDSVLDPPLAQKKWPADEILTNFGLTTPSNCRGEMLLYFH